MSSHGGLVCSLSSTKLFFVKACCNSNLVLGTGREGHLHSCLFTSLYNRPMLIAGHRPPPGPMILQDRYSARQSSTTSVLLVQKKKKKEAWQGGTALSQRIPQAGLEQQAQWLWDSYAASTRSTLLERAGLNGENFQF